MELDSTTGRGRTFRLTIADNSALLAREAIMNITMMSPTGTERRADDLKVLSFDTRDRMAQAAAQDVAAAIHETIAAKGAVRMIFAAAPSQADMLKSLVATAGLDFSRITAFHMDEYIGLQPAAPQRFGLWLDQHLFSHARFGAVHKIMPEPDAAAAAAEYEQQLGSAPIDIVCLGIGVNGHLAFNDPPVADFDDPDDVKIVELDEVCRQQQVDDACFSTIRDVPTHALTLTIPRLLRANRLFCVVPGPLKRPAVARTLHGPISTECPSTILRRHSDCTLYLDREADPDA
jgi:glucosamine-6-phosphate deaminase